MASQQEIDSFMSDPELTEILEQVKVSDDIMDVIDLSEIQQSAMLAWCLNPNEGHGQGDAVIKDFLVAAYAAGEGCVLKNKVFFSHWTPARIRTSSFGSAFVSREFCLRIEDAEEGSKKCLLDLFLVDPTNEIVVVIENKLGARLSGSQLEKYTAAVNQNIAARPAFNGYTFAYVVVDRKLSTYPPDHLQGLSNKWGFLDYQWLEVSARRARKQVTRNNQAARLLMSYCQRQSDWETPEERQLSHLAASLAVKHEAVIGMLKEQGAINITSWTPTKVDGPQGDLLRFVNQNRMLCGHLVQARGIAAVATHIRSTMPALNPDHLDVRRTWLALASRELAELTDVNVSEPLWPVYVNVQRVSRESGDKSRFLVRIVWTREHFSRNADERDVRAKVSRAFPKLALNDACMTRRVEFKRGLSASEAAQAAIELLHQLIGALKAPVAVPVSGDRQVQ